MKKLFTFILLLVCMSSFMPPYTPEVKGGNDLAIDMFESLSMQNSNFVFSPYSMRNCFAYVYPGAANETKSEMTKTLRFNNDPGVQLQRFKDSNDNLELCKDSKVKLANSMWIRDNYPLQPSYTALVKRYTDAVLPLTNAANVNDWAEKKTEGKIKQFIKDDSEIAEVKVLLVNCISIDALWKYPFEKKQTESQAFYTDKSTLLVPTMNATIPRVNLYQSNEIVILQLPYKDELSMTIMMPVEGKGFEVIRKHWAAMEDRLTGELDYFEEKNMWTSRDEVDLYLPKFKMESTHDMKPLFYNLGIRKAFSDTEADFSQMNGNLYIDLVKQKAMLEIEESGTKAAAASAIGMVERSIPETVRIDRPFAFIIHHIKTGEILFMGKLSDPSK